MRWHVISFACQMTHKQLASYTQNQWKSREYGTHECQVKIELYRKLHSSALHVRTAHHEDRMHAMDCVLMGNLQVPLQISRATVLGHVRKCQV